MVKHEIEPIFNQESKVLILGSFPSVKSRETNFFYGHPQNRFWKVLAAVCKQEVPMTITQKKEFLLENHIALWDVIASCTITGSSDSSIKDVKVNNIASLCKDSKITTIYTNGNTADMLYRKYIYPNIGIKAICLPSSSPANARYRLENLIDKWQVIGEKL